MALHPLVHSELESLASDEAQVECQLCQNLDELVGHRAQIDLAGNWEQPLQENAFVSLPVTFSHIFQARASHTKTSFLSRFLFYRFRGSLCEDLYPFLTSFYF